MKSPALAKDVGERCFELANKSIPFISDAGVAYADAGLGDEPGIVLVVHDTDRTFFPFAASSMPSSTMVLPGPSPTRLFTRQNKEHGAAVVLLTRADFTRLAGGVGDEVSHLMLKLLRQTAGAPEPVEVFVLGWGVVVHVPMQFKRPSKPSAAASSSGGRVFRIRLAPTGEELHEEIAVFLRLLATEAPESWDPLIVDRARRLGLNVERAIDELEAAGKRPATNAESLQYVLDACHIREVEAYANALRDDEPADMERILSIALGEEAN